MHYGSSKTPKTLLTKMFCIFECLLTQNPTNQGSQLPLNYLINYPKTGASRESHGSYPNKRWGYFKFEKLKSLKARVFFHPMGGLIMVTKDGGIIQVKIVIIL